MGDVITEIYAAYNMLSATTIIRNDNGSLKCTNKSNQEDPDINPLPIS